MPELWGVAESLGLDFRVVHDVGGLSELRAMSAMDSIASGTALLTAAHTPPAELVDYVCDHGFRAMGLLALSDQDRSAKMAEQLGFWLRHARNTLWPLSYAIAPIHRLDELAYELDLMPATSPRELCRCVIPDYLLPETVTAEPVAAEPRLEPAPLEHAEVRIGRAALSPYGIDLNLLQLIVRGRTSDPEPAVVSDISMAALVHTFFMSIEQALADQRNNGYHWSAGVSLIQATDPEVLLAIRACLRSEHARDHVENLPARLPMGRALVELMQSIESW